MSSGGQTTSSFQGPPQYIQDASQGYLQRQGELSGQDYTPYRGQRVADLSPTTQAGIRGIQDMAYGHPMGDDAVNMTRNTLQGNYSNPYAMRNEYGGENPYFMQQLGRGQEKITDAYNKGVSADTTRMFNQSGAFGGSAHQNQIKNNQEVLGQQLGDYTNNMLSGQYDRSTGLEESFLNRGSGAYENERGRQMGAVGGATSLLGAHSNNLMNAIQAGGIESGQYQKLLDSQYGDFNEWRNYGQQQNDQYGNALTRAMGGAGSTQTQTGPGPDPMSQGFGGLALMNMLSRSGGGGK